jgi:predicted nuclease with TOPRIM domain
MLSKQKKLSLFALIALCCQGSIFSGFEVNKIVKNSYVQAGAVAFTGATVLYLGYKNYYLNQENLSLKSKKAERTRQNDDLITENQSLKTTIKQAVCDLKDGDVETEKTSLEDVIKQAIEQLQNQKKLIEKLGLKAKEDSWFSDFSIM